MARYDGLIDQVRLQNGRPTFLQKITVGTTGAVTNLAAADADGAALPQGVTLALQADQDFFFYPVAKNATTSVTVHSGAKPGIRVPQYVTFYVTIGASDGALDCISTGAGTNLLVAVIK